MMEILSAVAAVLAAMVTVGIPWLTRRSFQKQHAKLERNGFALELREEQRQVIDRLRADVDVLREELDTTRAEMIEIERHYHECEQARQQLTADVEKLTARVEAQERNGG